MKIYETVQKVMESVKNLSWVELQFTDLAGYLRSVIISSSIIDEEVFVRGLGKLDGSSVRGFTAIEDSDLVLKPDPQTFATIPWIDGMARFICDVYKGDARFIKDPRAVAQRLDSMLHENGMRAFISAELEFFVFDRVVVRVDPWRQALRIDSSEGFWQGLAPFNRVKDGYFAPYPRDKVIKLKLEVGEVLKKYFGYEVEVLHHEVAGASQHEINIRGGDALFTADQIQTVKYVIRAIAHRQGFTAIFMPKPLYGDNGSGMHIHISLWRGEENLFYDPNDRYAFLSQYARYFIGGIIEHSRALSAIVSPTVNSYKRLVPGYEAPVYIIWSKSNRSAAIRIPNYLRDPKSARIEYRPPDPSANPYLALPAIVLAGLDGIRKKIDPGDPIDENVYIMSPQKRSALGIKELPRSLDEALDELESDNEWLMPVFPKELIESYIELKRKEAKTVNSYPTPIEFLMYYDI
jgi:glutamine synthetase